jgi:hypothetical protein
MTKKMRMSGSKTRRSNKHRRRRTCSRSRGGGEDVTYDESVPFSSSPPQSRFPGLKESFGKTWKKIKRFYNRRKTRQRLWRTALWHRAQNKFPFLQTKSVDKLKGLETKHCKNMVDLNKIVDDIKNDRDLDENEKDLELATYEFASIFSTTVYLSILYRLKVTNTNADDNTSNLDVKIKETENDLNNKCEDLFVFIDGQETSPLQQYVVPAMHKAFAMYIENFKEYYPEKKRVIFPPNFIYYMECLHGVLIPSDIISNMSKIPDIVKTAIGNGISLLIQKKPSTGNEDF